MMNQSQMQNGILRLLPTLLLILGVVLLLVVVAWVVLLLRKVEKKDKPAPGIDDTLPKEADLFDERCHRLEEVIRAQKQQISAMELQLDEAARMRHDFKQELLLLQEFARSGDREELERYLPQVKFESKSAVDIPLCPNSLVNTLLQYYFKKARASGIEIDAAVQADDSLWLSAGDVGVLLGNLLENAVTAAAEAPASQRRLRLRTTQREDCFVIAMGNTFGAPRAQKEDGGFASTKADHTGIGLNSIRAVAQQYEGDAKFVVDGDMFMSYVILFRPDITGHNN